MKLKHLSSVCNHIHLSQWISFWLWEKWVILFFWNTVNTSKFHQHVGQCIDNVWHVRAFIFWVFFLVESLFFFLADQIYRLLENWSSILKGEKWQKESLEGVLILCFIDKRAGWIDEMMWRFIDEGKQYGGNSDTKVVFFCLMFNLHSPVQSFIRVNLFWMVNFVIVGSQAHQFWSMDWSQHFEIQVTSKIEIHFLLFCFVNEIVFILPRD
jgi:hypothetical protein